MFGRTGSDGCCALIRAGLMTRGEIRINYITVFFTSLYFPLNFNYFGNSLLFFLVRCLTCPGMDCLEVCHLKKHCPKSFVWLLHTLPPAGPKTSSAERDEWRMQGFLRYRYLKDVSKFEFVAGVLQAESRPGLQWQFEQVSHPNPNWISCSGENI